MFTARVGLEPIIERRFTEALLNMSIENPVHRPTLEAEGLKRWIAADVDGYGALKEACREQGFFGHSARRLD
jgi:hypothetical protein